MKQYVYLSDKARNKMSIPMCAIPYNANS